MRSKNSFKSVITGFISNLVTIIVGFIAQAVFVKTLGNEYLGINGLFTNILSMLAIVELGFGSAIIVNLYKPVAEKNKEEIKSLLNFYKIIYRIIAIVVTIIGIILLPFLKYIVGEISIDINIRLVFVLYLIDTVSSYLLTYKRSIIQADQKNYIINIVHFGYTIIMNTLQIIYLIIFKEFIGYLVIKILCRIIENLVNTFLANRLYPFIKEKNIHPVSVKTKKNIFLKVKGLLFHKIGGFVVLGSNNIIISMTKGLGISAVGLYSNYYLIISALTNLFSQIFTSITASVGNLLLEKNLEKINSIYKSTLLMNSWLYAFASISFFIISKPFVEIWLGSEYLLSSFVVFVLAINFYVNGMRRTYTTFKEAAGVFYEDRFVPIIESLVNIIVSIILANWIGLAGVFIGTIVSNLVLFAFSFPKYVYRNILHGKIKAYIYDNLLYFLLFLLSFLLTYSCSKIFSFENNYITILFYAFICIIIPNLVFFIFKYKTPEFQYYKTLLFNIILKK